MRRQLCVGVLVDLFKQGIEAIHEPLTAAACGLTGDGVCSARKQRHKVGAVGGGLSMIGCSMDASRSASKMASSSRCFHEVWRGTDCGSSRIVYVTFAFSRLTSKQCAMDHSTVRSGVRRKTLKFSPSQSRRFFGRRIGAICDAVRAFVGQMPCDSLIRKRAIQP